MYKTETDQYSRFRQKINVIQLKHLMKNKTEGEWRRLMVWSIK